MQRKHRIGRNVVRVVTLAAVLAGSMSMSSVPASANGQGVWLCGQDNAWAGTSNSAQAITFGASGNTCGTKSVRAYIGIQGHYGWTGWSSGASLAAVSAGGATIWNGQHKVASCGWVYQCGPFQT